MKLGVWAGAPWDVQAYASRHPTFPCDSTIQQMYDEEFEAYRALGHAATHSMLESFVPSRTCRPEPDADALVTRRRCARRVRLPRRRETNNEYLALEAVGIDEEQAVAPAEVGDEAVGRAARHQAAADLVERFAVDAAWSRCGRSGRG